MKSTYTPEQAARLHEDWGVNIDPLYIDYAPPVAQPPATPQHDVAKIRKAYSKLLAAMTAAKEAGDEELLNALKPDYLAVKALLTEAKVQERALEMQANEARDKELQALREQVKLARKTIGDLKHENARLLDENRTLRAPPPVAEYKRAQTMTLSGTPIRKFEPNELLQDIDKMFG